MKKTMTDAEIIRQLCSDIIAERFDWLEYLPLEIYFGREIRVSPMICPEGQFGYLVYFPYSEMPELEYDWVAGELTVDDMDYREYLQMLPS
mgnify:FL=1